MSKPKGIKPKTPTVEGHGHRPMKLLDDTRPFDVDRLMDVLHMISQRHRNRMRREELRGGEDDPETASILWDIEDLRIAILRRGVERMIPAEEEEMRARWKAEVAEGRTERGFEEWRTHGSERPA